MAEFAVGESERTGTARTVVAPGRPVRRLAEHPSSFVGREAEIRQLAALLATGGARLITITGPGGVGKTRLALRVADEVADRFRDGVVVVELASIRDPGLALLTIAHGMRLGEAGDRPVAEILGSALAGRELLILLDNLEQITAAGPDIARLLALCPGLTLLATSRTPLMLRGEQRFPLAPLPLPDVPKPAGSPDTPEAGSSAVGPGQRSDAVRLFEQRAHSSDPTFVLDAENVATVAAICRAVDGLPLAIELAAARLRHLTPRTLLALLDRRLAVLTGGPADAPARQRTLRDTVAWSEALLEPDAQARFRRLAVFRDAFDLDAAAAIWETSAFDALGTISGLIDASLLVPRDAGDEARYGLLETVRAYCWDRLVAGEAVATQDRHAAHFSRLAAHSAVSIRRNGTPKLLDQLEARHDDLRAALSWYLRPGGDTGAALGLAASLPFFWYYRGFLSEGRAWLRRVLSAEQEGGNRGPSPARAWVLLGQGLLALVQGDYDEAQATLAASIAAWIDAGDAWGVAVARSLLGGVYVSQGTYARALPLFQASLGAFGSGDDRSWAAHVRFHLGVIAFAGGNIPAARTWLEDAVRRYDEGGDRVDGIDPLRYLALVACGDGDIPAATAALTDCFDRLHERGSIAALVPGIADAATLAVARDAFAKAAWLFAAAHRLRDRKGVRLSLPARAVYERAAAQAEAALGPDAFARETAAGDAAALEEVLAAVDALLEAPIPSPVTPANSPGTAAPIPGGGSGLTERELEVLRLLAAGRTNQEIGEALFISTGTARTHVSNILAKLDVRTRTEAAHVAHGRGLL